MDMLRYVVGIAVKIIWNIMLSLFPAVLYYGMLSALHVLTVQCDDVDLYGDSEIGRVYVDNNTAMYNTFSMADFVELFVLRPLLVEYLSDASQIKREDILLKLHNKLWDLENSN